MKYLAVMLVGALIVPLAGLAETSAADGLPDFAEHLVAQLICRTNGNSANFTGPTGARNLFQSFPTNTPNFWLRDVTNILAMSQGRMDGLRIMSFANYLTPVSPHICLAAAHTGRGDGTVNLWLRTDGSYYRNTVVSSLLPSNMPDIVLMFMARTNWTFVKIFPDATRKLKFWQQHEASNTVPVFIRFHQGIGRTNQFHSTFVSGSSGPGVFGHVNGQFEFGDYSRGDGWASGDSSGAAYAIIQNEAVLVCVASFSSSGTPIASYTNQINAATAALCASNGVPAEKLTLYDLSDFADY